MRAKYRYAILSLCEDLTDPNAESRPVGLVGVGSSDETGFLIVATEAFADASNILEDAYTEGLLDEFGSFIRQQIEDGLSVTSEDEIFDWLQDRLRNTIHVSEVSEPRSVLFKKTEPTKIIQDFFEVFQSRIGTLVAEHGAHSQGRSLRSKASKSANIGFPLPTMSFELLPQHEVRAA